MKLEIEKIQEKPFVDRDGIANKWNRQGFIISIDGFEIRFEDENDAVAIANEILLRMGESAPYKKIDQLAAQIRDICDK